MPEETASSAHLFTGLVVGRRLCSDSILQPDKQLIAFRTVYNQSTGCSQRVNDLTHTENLYLFRKYSRHAMCNAYIGLSVLAELITTKVTSL